MLVSSLTDGAYLPKPLNQMVSDNIIVAHLVELCAQHGIKHVILSPGSRNAPFTISFNEDKRFTTYTIVDERSAAFFALGLAQYTGEMTAICCTSGSAALNYGPALAEAYYQRIPILAITADRPEEWIDQSIGQSINQKNVFGNYIRCSHHLPSDLSKVNYAARLINEAILTGKSTPSGPVHLNVPLYEPLYNTIDKQTISPRKINYLCPTRSYDLGKLASLWNNCKRKLILVGVQSKDAKLNQLINQLAKDESVVILTETHSNLHGDNLIEGIDRVISGINDENIDDFTPDILLTIGRNIISKKIKVLLRRMHLEAHWDIDPEEKLVDPYYSLTLKINDSPTSFLSAFVKQCTFSTSEYGDRWKSLTNKTSFRHRELVENMPFSDFICFKIILDRLPKDIFLQMGNSSVVRYVQLFPSRKDISYFGNRGVSGIDGSTSTAVGAAYYNKNITCLISGDLSFFYDINALWNNYLSPNLRLIVINNSGGGIFRIIAGPKTTNVLEQSFEARHHTSVSSVAETYDLDYHSASNKKELQHILNAFFLPSAKAQLLEIITPPETNDQVLLSYFDQIEAYLKHEN